MRKSILFFINYLFDRWEQFFDSFKRSDLPGFDLYERKKYSGDFNKLRLIFVKILTAILLGYLIPLILSSEDSENSFKLILNSNSILFCAIIWIFIFTVYLHQLIKTIKFNYKVSINQSSILLFLSTFYFVLKSKNLISIKVYYDFDITGLTIILAWTIIFTSILNFYWPKYGKVQNLYIEDTPLPADRTLNEIDKNLLNKIKVPLLKDKYNNSFSIGIIGPWGWGKSSFINQLKAEVKSYSETHDLESQKDFFSTTPNNYNIGKQQIVTIEYSPFLNHSEDNLIDDFFIQLSNELNKYSNGLSKKVSKYAESLVESSENNFLKTIHQIVTLNFSEESSNEIYEEISEELTNLDLKTIVYIDDLDRLNPNEILQVLKLIRNTSNFPNFVFIVALDKEYVIRALKDLGDYTNRSFIDKFFQLECFLPEIEASDIIEKTIQFINERDIIFEKTELFDTIRNHLFIFTEYIQNFRDVKKFVNQLHFEYGIVSNIFNEIAIKDYLNLMLLKMKFPDYYRFIMNNYEYYFDNKHGILSLKEKDSKSSTEELIHNILLVQDSRYIRPKVSDYLFDGNLDCEEYNKRYTCQETDLIKRTLILLFTGNNNPNPKSVRRIANLKKMAYLRIAKTDLSNKELTELIEYYKQSTELNPKSRNLEIIKNIFKDNKIEQLITQLLFIYPEDSITIRAVILLTFDIIRVIKTNHRHFSKAQEILENYYNRNKAFDNVVDWSKLISEDQLKFLFKENFIMVEEIDILEKLEMLNFILKQNHYTGLWFFSEKELQNFQVDLIQSEAEKLENNWLPNDRKIFTSYFLIYDRLDEKLKTKLNQIMIGFLKNKALTVLFFNLLHPDYETQLTFRLNNIVLYIFGTLANFDEFLKVNYKKQLSAFPEVSLFLKLNAIVQNGRDLKFKFDREILIEDFPIQSKLSEIGINDIKNSIQIFLESNLSTREFDFSSISARNNGYLYSYEGNDYWLFVSNIGQTTKEKFIDQILNAFIMNFKLKHNKDCTIQIDPKNNYPFLLDQEKKVPLKVISIQ